MTEFDAKKYTEMQKYTRYLRNWADEHDGTEFHGMSPAGFVEWRLLKEQGFQPEEDYVLIGQFNPGLGMGVNTDDFVKMPHLHISKNNNDIACVGLVEPIYLPHSDDERELDGDEKEQLTELLNTTVDYPKFREAGITLWDYACLTWNYNNEAQIPEETEMPDYGKL